MNSPTLRAVPDNELHEVIWYALSDLHSLAKDFERYTHGNVIDLEAQEPTKISHLPRVKKYFSVDQAIMYSQKLFDSLEKLLREISEYATEIENLSESEQENVVTYIKKELDILSMSSLYEFPEKFRDMLFVELGIDHIDDTGDLKAEVKFVINKIMAK